LKWANVQGAELFPLILPEQLLLIYTDVGIKLDVNLHHVTEPNDYLIFDSFKSGNLSKVLDYIAEGDGINAFDEWGHTPLMIATQNDYLQVIAALLNARKPKVDVNYAKSVN
jgi:ankyrin repeat protein